MPVEWHTYQNSPRTNVIAYAVDERGIPVTIATDGYNVSVNGERRHIYATLNILRANPLSLTHYGLTWLAENPAYADLAAPHTPPTKPQKRRVQKWDTTNRSALTCSRSGSQLRLPSIADQSPTST